MKKLIVGIAILAALGAAGWFFYSNYVKTDTNQTNNSQDQQNQTQNDPSEGGKYLVIKEWGVRFELGDKTKNANYVYKSNSIVNLITKEVEQITGCENSTVMSLQRGKEVDPIGPTTVKDLLKYNPSHLTQVDDYYYGFHAGSFSCASPEDPEGLKLHSETRKEFEQIVKTLEPISISSM